MKVWMWPKTSELNPYNRLLTESLCGAGLDVRDLKHGKLALRVGRTKPGDVVHIHWMHHAYQNRNPLLFVAKSSVFVATLLYLKLRNVRIVWTIHNLYPHRMKFIGMERFMRKTICRLCDELIVASESIKRKASAEFGVPAGKLTVVKHGHYAGAYAPRGRNVRRQYGIEDDADVYLFLGAVQAYKGIDDLIEAFRAARTERTYLILAGKADKETEAYLRGAEDTENIVMDLRFIPNEEVADLIGAADVMVLPYKEITTSGSAILGLSFRKRLVMPDNEFIDEYFKEGMVVRYEPAAAEGLADAMRKAMEMSRDGVSSAYDEALKELEWNAIAKRTKDVYQRRDSR